MKQSHIIILIVIGLVIFFLRKPIKKGMSKLPRGLRNNNPGNIRLTKGKWQGEIEGTDKSFKTFKDIMWGYRAIFLLLDSYISKGYDTIRKIINRYAPPHENITSSYVKNVSKRAGIKPDKKISSKDIDIIKKIVQQISKSENGVEPNMNEILAGYELYKRTS